MKEVSVIVPCFNEQETIKLLLFALVQQTYPLNKIEVVISDGLSTDCTREEIKKFSTNNPELTVHIVDNKKKIIPAGLNIAIDKAVGEFIIRLDAHSVPDPDYIARCVQALKDDLGNNVGGVWEIKPGKTNPIARSIALAASHPLGVGDAKYRYTEKAGYVDTVPFGSFYKEIIDKIGPFDESLLTNEDYEFNTRIRNSGGKVWLDPKIRSTYFARSSLKELSKQYSRYGYWKAIMLQRYPESLRLRQAVPPVFVLSLLILFVLTFFADFFGILLAVELVLYILVLVTLGIHLSIKNRDLTVIYGVPAAMATMHISWGSAFLWSTLNLLKKYIANE